MTELSLQLIGLIGIVVFLILMFLKMHVGLALLLSGFIGITLSRGLTPALSTIGTSIYRVGSSEYLAVIPLFILMGILAGSGGLSKNAYIAFNKWFGHLRGGLAMATIATCAAFGAVCGDNLSAAITMTKAVLPEMRKYGYSDELSLGAIVCGGSLGILIPPSTAFILYGFVTETAIGALFISGILPGILLTCMFLLQIYIQCKINPALAQKAPAVSWKERLIATKGIFGIAIVFIIVMGGLLAGFFTPSEAGAVGAFAVLIVSIIFREAELKMVGNSLLEAGKLTAMVMLLIIGATVFSFFLTTAEMAQAFISIIEGLTLNRYVVMTIILFVYLLFGAFTHIWAVLLITLPIFFPIITSLGFDPLQFGVLCVLTIMIGCITPPVGVVVFALAGMLRNEVPFSTIFRGCAPFLLTMLLCVVILVAFPQISTALPDLMIPFR